jgi:hypothetical protein
MSNIKYMIRSNDFGYNDEWYITDYATLGVIKAIYNNHTEAEKTYKELVTKALYDYDLCNFDIFNGYAPDDLYEKINNFILEKTGKEFNGENLPEMNEEDAFEFAKLSGLLHYQLIKIDDSKPFNVILFSETNKYLYAETATNSIILTTQTDNPLFDFNFEEEYWRERTITNFFGELPPTLTGSLADLSDSPTLFQELITSLDLVYIELTQELRIDSLFYENQFDPLRSLNALLKQSLFEIRKITIEELAQL